MRQLALTNVNRGANGKIKIAITRSSGWRSRQASQPATLTGDAMTINTSKNVAVGSGNKSMQVAVDGTLTSATYDAATGVLAMKVCASPPGTSR